MQPRSEMNANKEDQLTHFGYLQIPKDEKVHWVRRHFNTVAQKYDFMNTVLSFGTHYLWKQIAVRMMNLQPGDRVIDVCGGTADLALLAAKDVGATGEVILYDINWAMLKMGRPKVERSPFASNVKYVQGNAEQISFADCSFEGAMVGFGIRNLTNPQVGFKEIHRVLKPGGILMCLEFSEPVTPWFRWLYDFYSFYIMPAVGKILGGCAPAYTYLPESIRLFPKPEQLSATMEEIGFSAVTFRRLTDGIAVIHTGVKK